MFPKKSDRKDQQRGIASSVPEEIRPQGSAKAELLTVFPKKSEKITVSS